MNEYTKLNEVLIEIGEFLKKSYQDKLNLKNKNASGTLFNSINYKLVFTENNFKLYFVGEKYWINVEDGRKAESKLPPIDAIRRWMKYRGISLNDRAEV